MPTLYSSLLLFIASTLTGAALFYKAFLHRKYYDEILALRGKHSFRNEENNIFTGEPLWQEKTRSSARTPQQRFDMEIFWPGFMPQNIDNKSDKAIMLEKRIWLAIMLFYISAAIMILAIVIYVT